MGQRPFHTVGGNIRLVQLFLPFYDFPKPAFRPVLQTSTRIDSKDSVSSANVRRETLQIFESKKLMECWKMRRPLRPHPSFQFLAI